MDQNPLVSEQIEAGARFLMEFEKRYPVAVAFWLKNREEREWVLHIASEKISDTKIREGYGEVHHITAQMTDVYFDPLNVILRKMDDPIVQFALDFQRRYPVRLATIFNVPTFEGVEVEGMYLYPPVKTVAA